MAEAPVAPSPQRRSRTVVAAVIVSLALIAGYVAMWFNPAIVSSIREAGSDFSAAYTAAEIVRDGMGSRIYDEDLEAAYHVPLVPPGWFADEPYRNPPTTAVLTVPLTFVGVHLAYRLVGILGVLALIIAGVIAARAAPWPRSLPRGVTSMSVLIGVAGVGTIVTLLLGQWDAINALGLALGYSAWRRGNNARAVFWITVTAMIAKPHLAVGIAAYILGRRYRRELSTAALTVIAVLATWLVIGGGGIYYAFVQTLIQDLGHTPAMSTMGFTGFFTSWLGAPVGEGFHPNAAQFIAFGVSVVALLACIKLGAMTRNHPQRLEACLAGAVALSLVSVPHLLAHDLLVMGPVVTWCVARAATYDSEHRRVWPGVASRNVLVGWLLFNLIGALDAGNSAPAPPGRLVPVALSAIAVISYLVARTQLSAPSGQLTSTRVVQSTNS